MRRTLAWLAVSLLALLPAGCGKSECKLAARPISGVLAGAPFSSVSASARVGHLHPSRIGIALFTQPLISENTQCDATRGGMDKVTSSYVVIQWEGAALQTGTRDVDVYFCRKSGTAADCGGNQAGQLRIDTISPEFLEGTACADGDDPKADSISGVFQAVNCVK